MATAMPAPAPAESSAPSATPFVCNDCNPPRTFKRPQALGRHVSSAHTPRRRYTHRTGQRANGRYPCAFCDLRFSTEAALNGHLKVHKGQRPGPNHHAAENHSRGENNNGNISVDEAQFRAHAGFAFGHCKTWLEIYADSINVSRADLAFGVGELLRNSARGKVLGTVHKMPALRGDSTF
jgi:hypothetical protein